MNEIWRSIKDWFGVYEVSNYGRIKRLQRLDSMNRKLNESIRKTRFNKGYEIITLKAKGKEETSKIHILVAQAFPEICGEWFEGCDVHHKDFNRLNNCALNLCVITKEEHQKLHHNESMYEKFEETKKQNNSFNTGKRVLKYTLDGEFIEEYKSINKASILNNVDRRNLQRAINTNKNCGGYLWKLSA